MFMVLLSVIFAGSQFTILKASTGAAKGVVTDMNFASLALLIRLTTSLSLTYTEIFISG